MSPRPGRPLDGGVEHRRPDAQTPPPDDHEHPDVSDPVGGDIDRNVADESRTSHRGGIRDQYGRRNPRRESVEQATAGSAIERNLDTGPAALCSDGPRLFDQFVEILGACRSDDCRPGRLPNSRIPSSRSCLDGVATNQWPNVRQTRVTGSRSRPRPTTVAPVHRWGGRKLLAWLCTAIVLRATTKVVTTPGRSRFSDEVRRTVSTLSPGRGVRPGEKGGRSTSTATSAPGTPRVWEIRRGMRSHRR